MSNHPPAVTPPIVLVIAGFDPSGGAGVAADLKTIAAHNGYGIAAITALTVQSTQGVKSVHPIPSATLRAQLDALIEDVTPAAVKIGMLGNRANAVVVAEFLDRAKIAHVVLDPVIQPTAGEHDLLDAAGVKFLNDELLKRSTVVTPNVPEATMLTGITIKDVAGMEAAAREFVARGAKAAVVKGGHMERAVDVLFDGAQTVILGGDLVKLQNTHGSGCTFASAIAAQLAAGRPLREAVTLAKTYVTLAMERGFSIGKGPGPLDHFYRMHHEAPMRGVHEVPQHGMHPAAEPSTR
ncbi:MAG TPA: bifunctional hydroxymethylpyrimidine kinase/phosphomethylpyrimidine kinase [Candidatus Acidoferrales bacterium]|nr:bifunctional hydroxymethylpyrimidine kinase/phosphomethylpyrimidine kinase [Candidatus Acidoferrales bacterium]